MVKSILSVILALAFTVGVRAQEGQGAQIPSVKIKNVGGTVVNTADFGTTDKPVIISFWATWC